VKHNKRRDLDFNDEYPDGRITNKPMGDEDVRNEFQNG
jgi:hypothetical protein